ncbi:unnamed protein product, partial [marine sediment metagenome]
MKVLFAFGGVKSRYHPTGDVIATTRMAEAIQQYSKHDLRLMFAFGDKTDYQPCKSKKCAKNSMMCEKCTKGTKINMGTYAKHILEQEYDILFVRGNLLMQHIYHLIEKTDTRPRILFWVEETASAGNDPQTLQKTKQIDREALACADHICSFTEGMLQASKQYLSKNIDGVMLPICVDATKYRLPPPKQLAKIGYAGGFNPTQDISPILEEISSKNLPYKVLIACPNGIGREKYAMMVKILGMDDKVKITSFD